MEHVNSLFSTSSPHIPEEEKTEIEEDVTPKPRERVKTRKSISGFLENINKKMSKQTKARLALSALLGAVSAASGVSIAGSMGIMLIGIASIISGAFLLPVYGAGIPLLAIGGVLTLSGFLSGALFSLTFSAAVGGFGLSCFKLLMDNA